MLQQNLATPLSPAPSASITLSNPVVTTIASNTSQQQQQQQQQQQEQEAATTSTTATTTGTIEKKTGERYFIMDQVNHHYNTLFGFSLGVS